MKICPGVSELWRVENRPLPLTRPMAYTTACTTVQAVMLETVKQFQALWDVCKDVVFVYNNEFLPTGGCFFYPKPLPRATWFLNHIAEIMLCWPLHHKKRNALMHRIQTTPVPLHNLSLVPDKCRMSKVLDFGPWLKSLVLVLEPRVLVNIPVTN